ncbi:MAG: Rho GTPase [Watsoniomyces obsoletus]|nr:MAG: Rho GTPase [Watsoniomyces obsoletus]
MDEKAIEAAPAVVTSPENNTPAVEDDSHSPMELSNNVDQINSPKPDGVEQMDTPPSLKDDSAVATPADEENDEVPEDYEDDKGGLFGEGSDEEQEDIEIDVPIRRALDDIELDSGDDEGHTDPLKINNDTDDESDKYEGAINVAKVVLPSTITPKGSDGQTYLLKIPKFIALEPTAFDPETFELSTTDDQPKDGSVTGFSARAAMNAIRWRHSPTDPSQIQSNARIIKWSDGSMTLQLAGSPETQYELDVKPLAAPIHDEQGQPVPYDPKKDTHTYLVAPVESDDILRITNHLTGAIAVMPSAQADAESLARLHQSLMSKRLVVPISDGRNMITVTEDPELAKRKAEQAEREQLRQQKKIQNTMAREMERSRPLTRLGPSRRGGAGLSVGGLEDSGDGSVFNKGSKARRAQPAARKPARRGRYSDDEDDDMPRFRSKEDEYDKTDDFLADSDEEEDAEFEEDDNDDDDLGGSEEDEEMTEEKSKKTKGKLSREKTSTKPTGSPKTKHDEDDKEKTSVPNARGKRRRAIVDDDEDE